MAGIENTKEAIGELKNILLGLKAIAPGGFEGKDFGTAIQCGKDTYDLYVAAMAAHAAGEITDLDMAEIKELFGDISALISELLKPAA